MAETPAYQVLARKYRPAHFRDLIGQGAMVQTLTNAFAHDRIAHAFVLTGVRGVGKTTTARIIAKGLNCTGRGERPTIDPCGTCDACVAIAAGRHVDVLEIDAASNTGVDNIREITESVRYRAASARYKVYIIDEVHMLSTSAFNALLKTLEEPPAHVKFIFATTEIRKVPVTVLSRCQRFDLRRIEADEMLAHLAQIAAAEGAEVAPDALGLIVRAAEGSVRDALSLLDQAIAHGQGGALGADALRAMLGLADRGRVIDLMEAILRGDAAGALAELGAQYADGADPALVLRDLAELAHWLSVLKISDAAGEDPTIPPAEAARGRDLAARLSVKVLARAWAMLLKAIEEVALAPTAMMAAEMAVIRLTHVADLPTPDDLVRRLTGETPPPPSGRPTPVPGGGGGGARATALRAPAAPAVAQAPDALAAYPDFAAVCAMIRNARDLLLLDAVETHVELVNYRPGLIEFAPGPQAPRDLAGRLSERLRAMTGARWTVSVVAGPGAPSIRAAQAAARAEALDAIADHPLVLAALAAFPDARLIAARPIAAALPPPDADPGVEIEGALIDPDDPFLTDPFGDDR